MTSPFLLAALAYAARGWSVFPLHSPTHTGCTCGKPDCSDAGKHPMTAHGLKDATTDPDQIRAWWTRWPDANVGIATGDASDLLVLDLDTPQAEAEALSRGIPAAPCVTTSKGLHVYFRAVPDAHNRVRFAPGMDIRATGGYVVAPPSVHPSGAVYRWEVAPDHVTTMPDAPAWLVESVSPQAAPRVRNDPRHYAQRPIAGTDAGAAALLQECVQAVAAATEGTRNDTLNRAAYTVGGLIGAGRLAPDGAVDALRAAALGAGLSEQETDRTIRSGLVAGAMRPIEDRPMPAPNGDGHAAKVTTNGVSPGPASSGPVGESWPPPAPGRDTPRRFTLVRAVDFRDRPAPGCLIEGILQVDSLAALVGPWGSYKSFILLDMALSIATGQPWAGRTTKQGPVVYVSSEGNARLGLRLKAWEIARRTPLDDAPLYILPDTVTLMDPAQVDELLASIRETVGDALGLVVIDTLARAMTGGDENSARDMGLLVEGAERIRRATGAVVAFAHHPAKNGNGGGRGSGALPGAIATEIRVDKSGNVVTLECGKQKDMGEFEPFALVPRIVELDDVGTTSVVLDLATGANPTPAQAGLATILARFGDTGATDGEWQKAAKAAGISRPTYYRQKPVLLASGAVTTNGKTFTVPQPPAE